jgi:hypothetical protein
VTPLARLGFTAANPRDQSFVDLADEPLADGRSAREVLASQLECLAVVEQLADVVRIRAGDLLSGPDSFGLIDAQLRALDVRRVMSFEQERALPHAPDPFFGEGGGFEKTAGALDGRERGGDEVRDGEAGVEAHGV